MKCIFLIACLLVVNRCLSQTFISWENAMDDIDFYNETIQEVHYNPFLFADKNKYFAETEAVKNGLPDSIRINEFITVLYRLSALLKYGHNAPYIVQPAIIDELKKELFFPVGLIIEKNKLFQPQNSSAAKGIPPGAEIISINHINMNSILPDIQQYFGGSKPYTEEMSARLLSYFLFLSGIKAPFLIQYIDPSGVKMEKKTTTGLKFKDALAVTMPHITHDYSSKMVEGKLGYINFMDMSGNLNGFNQFLDSCIV